MKKLLITLLILVSACAGASAQLLWKISGNGLDRPSYLFGTHHLAPVSVIDSVPGLNRVIATVDAVYGEMDMAKANSPESQQKMMMMAMAPADSLLTMVLTPAQLDSLGAVMTKYLGPMADVRQFAPFKPAMLSTTLSVLQSQRNFPTFDPTQQLDLVIQQRAAKAGKRVDGLETVEQQASLLFGTPILEQVEQLMSAVRMDEKSMEFSTRLATAYLNGDLEGMLALIEDPELGAGEASDRLLNARNANWVRFMAGFLPTASVLIAVGAGHLPGDKGLISLLRKEGFDVTPVEN